MAAPEPVHASEACWPDRLGWLMLGALALVAALTFRDYGLGWDDYTHAQYGELLLSLYTSGFRDTRALSFVNLYYYGGGFDMAAAALAKILPFDLFETRRLMGAVVGLIGLAATWRIARRVAGPLAGLLALVLLATCPLYYGHMFINPKDGPFAAAMAVFLLGLVRAFEQYPRPSTATWLILGIGFGLSIGSRIMAGFGVVTALAALALVVVVEKHDTGWRTALHRSGIFLLALVPAAIVAYAAMALVWPWSVIDPLNLLRAMEYFSHFFEEPWHELFEGTLITPPEMPRSYVPVLFGLKLPEVLLVLASSGIGIALFIAVRGEQPAQRRAVYLCVALAALLPLGVAVLLRPAMYNGIRHFVFVLPPLAVAGGLAGAWIAEQLARFGRAALVAFSLVFAAGILLPVAGMVRLHPYEYVWFNQISGGVRAAQSRYMLDYWGLAFEQAGAALRQELTARGEHPPQRRKWKIAVCGPHPPAQVALGEQFAPTWDPKGADFALMLGAFYCAKLPAPQLVEIVRDGIVFARAYDIRGREILSLFTEPPVEPERR